MRDRLLLLLLVVAVWGALILHQGALAMEQDDDEIEADPLACPAALEECSRERESLREQLSRLGKAAESADPLVQIPAFPLPSESYPELVIEQADHLEAQVSITAPNRRILMHAWLVVQGFWKGGQFDGDLSSYSGKKVTVAGLEQLLSHIADTIDPGMDAFFSERIAKIEDKGFKFFGKPAEDAGKFGKQRAGFRAAYAKFKASRVAAIKFIKDTLESVYLTRQAGFKAYNDVQGGGRAKDAYTKAAKAKLYGLWTEAFASVYDVLVQLRASTDAEVLRELFLNPNWKETGGTHVKITSWVAQYHRLLDNVLSYVPLLKKYSEPREEYRAEHEYR